MQRLARSTFDRKVGGAVSLDKKFGSSCLSSSGCINKQG